MLTWRPSFWTFGIRAGSLKPVLAAMTIRTPLSVDSPIPRADLATLPLRRVLLTESFGIEQKVIMRTSSRRHVDMVDVKEMSKRSS